MTKEDFKILINSLYSNNQLFIPVGTNINDWIDSSYKQSEAKDKEIEELNILLKHDDNSMQKYNMFNDIKVQLADLRAEKESWRKISVVKCEERDELKEQLKAKEEENEKLSRAIKSVIEACDRNESNHDYAIATDSIRAIIDIELLNK